MPNKPADASSAVDEAIRTIAEAPRWNSATNRQFIRTWAGGLEALMNASFEVQNAWLAAWTPLLETSFSAQKSLLAAWSGVAEQQQRTALSLLRRWSADSEKLLTPTN